MADDKKTGMHLPPGALSMEEIKKRNPKPGVFVFEDFYKRDDNDLVARVRQSMRENLGRDVTEQEARNYLKICSSFARAGYAKNSSSAPRQEKLAENRLRLRLDTSAADNGKKKTLRDWCFYWDEVKDGRVMASAADIYEGFKELKSRYSNSSIDEKVQASYIIKGLRKDLRASGLIASTRLDYSCQTKNKMPDYSANIIHHYNCRYSRAKTNQSVEVPHFSPIGILSAAKLPGGEKFLQALLGTSDSPADISDVFSFISGVHPDKVKIWTPDEDDRKKRPHRVASFNLKSSFYIIAATSLDYEGLSIGYLL